MNYYKPHNFVIQELVPPEIYQAMGNNSLLVMDDRILRIADFVRDYFDVPVTINNWHGGGQFSQRGFRTQQQAGGADHSPHFYGRAADFDVKGMTADEVRKAIMEDSNHGDFSLITGMELNISWIHLDVDNRYSASGGIVTFAKPKP